MSHAVLALSASCVLGLTATPALFSACRRSAHLDHLAPSHPGASPTAQARVAPRVCVLPRSLAGFLLPFFAASFGRGQSQMMITQPYQPTTLNTPCGKTFYAPPTYGSARPFDGRTNRSSGLLSGPPIPLLRLFALPFALCCRDDS